MACLNFASVSKVFPVLSGCDVSGSLSDIVFVDFQRNTTEFMRLATLACFEILLKARI